MTLLAFAQPSPPIDVHMTPGWVEGALRRDVTQALVQRPRILPPRWLYDDCGSELFDKITRLPEYYPTRAEASILKAHATEIAALSQANTVIELGSGTSEKTHTLLAAFGEQLTRFVPFDVSEGTLRDAAIELTAAYPGVQVHGVVGDFNQHLHTLPAGGRRLLVFLGSTIGNFYPEERATFLANVAASLSTGDSFLLGTDLVKAEDRLVAAYDDASGVTAAFNLNVLRVINRALHADFDPAKWQHVALWDAKQERMDLRLRSRCRQEVRVQALGITAAFARDEDLHTEISTKFRLEEVHRELQVHGFERSSSWTDEAGDYGLTLVHRV